MALMIRKIHGDDQAFGRSVLPGEGDETVVRRIAVPGRTTFNELPVSVAYRWLLERGEQAVVELGQLGVGWFGGCSDKVR